MEKYLDLPTPCLILDLDRFEANVDKMSRWVGQRSVAFRPHAKTHKCVEIARRQLAKGAVGICVATIAEAEVMTRGGVRGLLITAEMVGQPKIRRLLEVVKQAPETMIVVDEESNAVELQLAASSAGLRLSVLIDLDVGQNRTGALPGEPVLRLAKCIADALNLDLRGICAYAGHIAHVTGFEERRRSSRKAILLAIETRNMLRRSGFNMEILTGGSTGTYNIDPDIDGFTELQAGSYVVMDVDYRRIGGAGGPVYEDFQPALTVLSTVVHRSENKAVVDAGLKAFATDRAFGPEPLDFSGVTYQFAGDEHGRLILDHPSRGIALGDKLRFIIPHCDPNVNLYDRFYCVRGQEVVDEWSIMDRGAGTPYF